MEWEIFSIERLGSIIIETKHTCLLCKLVLYVCTCIHNRSHIIVYYNKGMTFTIEPMIVEGDNEIAIWEDDWTIVTLDNSRCSQFEHTVLITPEGCEVLTVV